MTTNVSPVVKAKLSKKNKPKPKKQIAKASKAFSVSLQTGTTACKRQGRQEGRVDDPIAKTRKGAKK